MPSEVNFSVGLTGGIGSGKSLVAHMFGELGAAIIDTDLIAHELTAPGGRAIPAIKTAFGDTFLTPDGAMDRTRMRELVFADRDAKRRLESILHPMIGAETRRLSAEAQGSYPIFVVPLLVESGTWKQRVSRVLVVDCPEELQLERVMKRSAMTEMQVHAIMNMQATRRARLAAADDVIVNDGDIETLKPKVESLHRYYLAMAS